MRFPIHGTLPAHVVHRNLNPLLMLIGGAVLLGGGSLSAGEAPKMTRQQTGVVNYVTPPRPIKERDTSVNPYNSFFPRSDAPYEDKSLSEKVSDILSRLSTPYPARLQHFSWLANDPLFQKAAYRMDGWGGVLMEVKELPDKGWIAKVRMTPYVAAPGRSVVLDYVEEVYRYQNGVLTLVETDAATPKPEKHHFILH